MPESLPAREGKIPFRGFQVWYRIVGDGEAPGKFPLLCLHGGPGFPCDYLEPLEGLASGGRRVIFYDQLGCGNSDQPRDPSLWTVALFLEELGVVRKALGLDRVHLLGQSWGGMLAMEYVLTGPSGVLSLTPADSPSAIPQWMEEANRLRSELPIEVQATLHRHESAGTTDSPEYEEATMVFYRRHVCRLDPWPECLMRAFGKFSSNPEVYHTMCGPSEFCVTGTLKDWDITARLGEIKVPALVISGRYDEATPAIAETVHRGIAGSEWELFENSAHMPHLEETEKYLSVVNRFLERVEKEL